jgi:hypothetical protein
MRVLFAAPYCLIDPSSGAAISCRTILESLAAREHQAHAFTATIFDRALFVVPVSS